MVIDTSAIFAAVMHEPDSEVYRDAILASPLKLISTVTLLETQIVLLARKGEGAIAILNELVKRAGIAVVPFDALTAQAAFEAFRYYGKGRGHKAQLNIVDCIGYALAKTRDLPLLFKGNDFAHTDVQPALMLPG